MATNDDELEKILQRFHRSVEEAAIAVAEGKFKSGRKDWSKAFHEAGVALITWRDNTTKSKVTGNPGDELSLCPGCNCMTHGKDVCAKCGAHKYYDLREAILGSRKPDKFTAKQVIEIELDDLMDIIASHLEHLLEGWPEIEQEDTTHIFADGFNDALRETKAIVQAEIDALRKGDV